MALLITPLRACFLKVFVILKHQKKRGKDAIQGEKLTHLHENIARYIDKVADDYIPNLDVMMIYRLDRFGRGGHHRPFNEVGFPAVRIMETNEHYDRQHQNIRTENGREYGDVLSGVDFDFNAKLTSLNAVTLASMAWAPAPPANTQISGAVKPSTTLTWQRPQGKMAENLAGYRVHWRLTTDATWDKQPVCWRCN